MNQTAQWLEDYLTTHGRSRSSEVKLAAERAGHVDSVLNKTRRAMRIVIHRNDDRTTDWELPATTNGADARTAEDMERDQSSATEIDLDADDDQELAAAEPIRPRHFCPTCGQEVDRPIAVAPAVVERSPAAAARASSPPCPQCGEGMIFDNRGINPPYFCRTHGRTM